MKRAPNLCVRWALICDAFFIGLCSMLPMAIEGSGAFLSRDLIFLIIICVASFAAFIVLLVHRVLRMWEKGPKNELNVLIVAGFLLTLHITCLACCASHIDHGSRDGVTIFVFVIHSIIFIAILLQIYRESIAGLDRIFYFFEKKFLERNARKGPDVNSDEVKKEEIKLFIRSGEFRADLNYSSSLIQEAYEELRMKAQDDEKKRDVIFRARFDPDGEVAPEVDE